MPDCGSFSTMYLLFLFIGWIAMVQSSFSETSCVKGSLKRYVTPEGRRYGSKLCYEPLRKLEGGEGGFSNAVTYR